MTGVPAAFQDWAAYAIAFLYREEIILVPHLLYKADLRYTSRDDRYALYHRLVEASSTVVYVTSNHPKLDSVLRNGFTRRGVTFHKAQIGSYHVSYDLSAKVSPEEMQPWN